MLYFFIVAHTVNSLAFPAEIDPCRPWKKPGLATQQDGVGIWEVARQLAVSHFVICCLQQCFQATGWVAERPRSGRPRKTTEREDRYIANQAMQTQTMTATKVRAQVRATTTTNISRQTGRNHLHDQHLHLRQPVVQPRPTPQQKATCSAWSTHHVKWIHQQWNPVLFIDTSMFRLELKDSSIWMWIGLHWKITASNRGRKKYATAK